METERLFFRKIAKGDLQILFSLFSDPLVMKFSLSGVCSLEKTKKILQSMLQEEETHSLGVFVVINKDTQEWMGIVGVSWQDKISVVYRFFPRFWNQGYATEALRGFIRIFQKQFPSENLYVYIEEENIPSIKVAQKIPMKFVKKTLFHNKRVLEYIYPCKN